MKKTNKHQFANVHFICSMVALKERNNRISNEKRSETAQKSSTIIKNNILAHPVIAVTGYLSKKLKTVSTHQFASLKRGWENKSAMSDMRSAIGDRSHSQRSVTLCFLQVNSHFFPF